MPYVLAISNEASGEAIISVNVSAAKQAAALAEGATAFMQAAGGDTDGRITAAAGGKVPAVIDLVKSGATATFGFDVLRKGGKMVQAGLFGGELACPCRH